MPTEPDGIGLYKNGFHTVQRKNNMFNEINFVHRTL